MPESKSARPFPWHCPKCRRKEVRRVTIPYECTLVYRDQPITVSLANLAVPKCGNCGELVFDYEADDQINKAYEAQTRDRGQASLQIPTSFTSNTHAT